MRRPGQPAPATDAKVFAGQILHAGVAPYSLYRLSTRPRSIYGLLPCARCNNNLG
jgi:hypothetical protein